MVTVQTTTQFAFIDALMTQLTARAALATGVQLSSGPLDLDKATEPDILQLFGTDVDEDFAAIGNKRHEETFRLEGELLSVRPGASEDIIVECRERAQELYAELEDEIRLNTRMNGTVKWCRISRATIQQGYGDKGRICVVSFTIEAFASLRLS